MKKRVIFWFLTGVAAFALLIGLVAPSGFDAAGDLGAHQDSLPQSARILDRAPRTAAAMALAGRVWNSRGEPVAEAEVRLTVARAQDALFRQPCLRDHPAIARCQCPDATADIARWIESDALDWPEPREVVLSDEEGAFLLAMPTGEELVLIEAMSADNERATLRLAARDIRQTHADAQALLHIHLGPAHAITGRVSDTWGRPIAEAAIAALSLHTPRARLARTDAQGRFWLDDLDAVPHRLVATAPEHLAAGALFNPAHESGPVDFVLHAPCALVGQVWTPGGQAAAGARLTLSDGEHARHHIATGALGHFSFEGLTPGRYDLLATLGQASAQASVRCPANDESPSVSLRLVEGLRVSGVVREALTGQPIAGARVRALFLESPGVESQSGADGAFELSGVPRGSVLIASAEGFLSQTMPLTAADALGSAEEIAFELRQRQSVSGQIVRGDGLPVPHVQVVLSRGHEMTSAFSDSDGRFHLDVESPGLVTIEAHHSALGSATRSVEAPSRDVLLQLDPLAQITATAVARQGAAPIAGARLRAEPATASARQNGQAFFSDFPSGQDGALCLAGLNAGVYDVIVSAPGFLQTRFSDVPLSEGERLDLGRVELSAGMTIEGRVRQSSGKPAAGARVTAHQPAALSTLSDASGHFAL